MSMQTENIYIQSSFARVENLYQSDFTKIICIQKQNGSHDQQHYAINISFDIIFQIQKLHNLTHSPLPSFCLYVTPSYSCHAGQ